MIASMLILANLVTMQPPPTEELHFLQPQVNLGELRSHVAYAQRFEFVNQGMEALEIDHVEPSCGCVAAKVEKRRYQPTEKGELVLEIKPTTQANGLHSWFAKVIYRTGQRTETVRLQLEAVVRCDVSVTPTVLVWTGAGSQEVTVSDLRDAPLSVKVVQFSSPLVRAETTAADKGVTRIVLQANGPLPIGRRDEMLFIYTSDPLYSPLRIPVTLIGQARSSITITPEQVERKATTGQPLPATMVRLRPAGQRAVKIQGVSADDPAITCTFAHGPFNEATLRIQIDAGKLGERALDAAVRVQVSEPMEEVLVIPVRITR